jgi:hypothetical protein
VLRATAASSVRSSVLLQIVLCVGLKQAYCCAVRCALTEAYVHVDAVSLCTAYCCCCSAHQYFDVDGDGIIEYEEFVNTLKRLDIGLSDSQVSYGSVTT